MMQRPAFTLIELLIVITIMGILAATVILSFNGARERQQLSLLADKSVAMLQVAQQDLRAGKYDSTNKTFLCEGAYFAQGAEPLFLSMPYDSETAQCDFASKSEDDYGLATAPAVVGEITVGDATMKQLYAVYTPPDGVLEFLNADGTAQSGDGMVTFSSGGGGEAYTISLQLSALTGLSSLSLTQ